MICYIDPPDSTSSFNQHNKLMISKYTALIINSKDHPIYITTYFFLFCHTRSTSDVSVRPNNTYRSKFKLESYTYLVRIGATDGTKAEEETKRVARRMAWTFMVVNFYYGCSVLKRKSDAETYADRHLVFIFYLFVLKEK